MIHMRVGYCPKRSREYLLTNHELIIAACCTTFHVVIILSYQEPISWNLTNIFNHQKILHNTERFTDNMHDVWFTFARELCDAIMHVLQNGFQRKCISGKHKQTRLPCSIRGVIFKILNRRSTNQSRRN